MNIIDKQKYADDLRARMRRVNLFYRKLWKKYRAVVTEIAEEHYKNREAKDGKKETENV